MERKNRRNLKAEKKFRRIVDETIDKLSNKQMIKLAAEMISAAFVWDNTKEGHEYWSRVHKKLLKMSEEIEVNDGKRRIEKESK